VKNYTSTVSPEKSDKRTHKPRRIIPAEERPMAKKTERTIQAFEKLLRKLSATTPPTTPDPLT
jgi:hypothetical protein